MLPKQGEIWWAEIESARRPVLIVTRSEAIAVLTGVVVAPVTRTIRSIPTEVILGVEEGVSEPCVATFDNLQRIPRWALTSKIGQLGLRTREICFAIKMATDC
jgi:mRNA interferase MazF